MGRAREQARRLGEGILRRRAGFRSEFLDFDRGIRMGHLLPEERITQIVKERLGERHGTRMICDRWGRGVYWQWICWVPEPNKKAKPLSSGHNFGSAKFFVSIDREERVFKAGMQIERAPTVSSAGESTLVVESDWDWHVLRRRLRAGTLTTELRRLVKEGFRIRVGPFETMVEYDRRSWDPDACRRRTSFARSEWGGFQLFWSIPQKEVKSTPGEEILDAVLAVFDEITPAMNLCMYAPCLKDRPK